MSSLEEKRDDKEDESVRSKDSPSVEKKETSPILEPFKEAEEEKTLHKELSESDNEQPEKIKQELHDASKLKIKPTPEAVKQEPGSPEPLAKICKMEDDIKRWKTSLIRIDFQTPAATQINDEDYLVNREGYKMNRDVEFATGQHSKVFKCKKEGVDQMLKITPLKSINLRYKNNLLKSSVTIMRYLIDNQHPSLVQHYAFFQSTVKLYIFMEPLGNVNLHAFIKKNRKPTSSTYLQRIKKFGRDVAEGINHLSVLGIAHCNIKTVNVCLTIDQANAKIVGFNNSVLVYNPIKSEEVVLPKYTEWCYNHAPETAKGDFKPLPADVWSFGVMIVCLLSGM